MRHSVSWGKKEDEVWEDAADLARTEQTSISQIVLRSLQEYTKRHMPGNPQTSVETFKEGEIPESLKQKYPEKIISILEGFPKDKLQLLKSLEGTREKKIREICQNDLRTEDKVKQLLHLKLGEILHRRGEELAEVAEKIYVLMDEIEQEKAQEQLRKVLEEERK